MVSVPLGTAANEETMYNVEKETAPLIGRTVLFVEVTPVEGRKVNVHDEEHDSVTLYLDNHTAFAFALDGDCCSSSVYTPEGIDAFKELVGARIQKIEERSSCTGGVVVDPVFKAREEALIEKYPPEETDAWHFLVFETNKGHVTIDWRNMSNGYYDGACRIIAAEPLPWPAQDAALASAGENIEAVAMILNAVRKG